MRRQLSNDPLFPVALCTELSILPLTQGSRLCQALVISCELRVPGTLSISCPPENVHRRDYRASLRALGEGIQCECLGLVAFGEGVCSSYVIKVLQNFFVPRPQILCQGHVPIQVVKIQWHATTHIIWFLQLWTLCCSASHKAAAKVLPGLAPIWRLNWGWSCR